MQTKNPKVVIDLKDLVQRIEAGQNEFFISLAGGGLRSSKDIWYDSAKKQFEVFHSVSGCMEKYSHDELLTETNIGKALEVGALISY